MDARVFEVSAGLMGWDRWDEWEPVSGGRAQVAVARRGETSYVVKAYGAGDPTRGARERAALVTLAGAAGAPRLLAESDDPPLVVMSRLEGTVSLADLLLGADPDRAGEAVLRWADTLAALHTASSPAGCAAFAAALDARGTGLDPWMLTEDFAEAADRYAALLPELGLAPHEAALRDLRALPSWLSRRGHEVLTPADTCPDNNLLVGGEVRLIDYEFAQLRHAAWDVAYLHAPWPSCWCAWQMPDAVGDAAVERYAAARGEQVVDPAFREDLVLATLGWRLMSPAFFIAGALSSDDRDADPRRPTRRSFVLHRLGRAAAMPGPATLVDLARDVHAVLLDRWGAVPLEVAPAFRHGSGAGPSRTVGS